MAHHGGGHSGGMGGGDNGGGGGHGSHGHGGHHGLGLIFAALALLPGGRIVMALLVLQMLWGVGG